MDFTFFCWYNEKQEFGHPYCFRSDKKGVDEADRFFSSKIFFFRVSDNCLWFLRFYNGILYRFEDYSWNALTDSAVANWKIPKQFCPSIYAGFYDSGLTLIQSEGEVIKNYKRMTIQPEQ